MTTLLPTHPSSLIHVAPNYSTTFVCNNSIQSVIILHPNCICPNEIVIFKTSPMTKFMISIYAKATPVDWICLLKSEIDFGEKTEIHLLIPSISTCQWLISGNFSECVLKYFHGPSFNSPMDESLSNNDDMIHTGFVCKINDSFGFLQCTCCEQNTAVFWIDDLKSDCKQWFKSSPPDMFQRLFTYYISGKKSKQKAKMIQFAT